MFLADGEAGFQAVCHSHLRVGPRTAGDGFRIKAAGQVPPRAELDAAAADIRKSTETGSGQ